MCKDPNDSVGRRPDLSTPVWSAEDETSAGLSALYAAREACTAPWTVDAVLNAPRSDADEDHFE